MKYSSEEKEQPFSEFDLLNPNVSFLDYVALILCFILVIYAHCVILENIGQKLKIKKRKEP